VSRLQGQLGCGPKARSVAWLCYPQALQASLVIACERVSRSLVETILGLPHYTRSRLGGEINSGVQRMCDLAAFVPLARISPGGTTCTAASPVVVC